MQGVDAAFTTASCDTSVNASDTDALLKALAKMSTLSCPPTSQLFHPEPSDKSKYDMEDKQTQDAPENITLPTKNIEIRNSLPQRWEVDAKTIDLGSGECLLIVISGFSSKHDYAYADVQVSEL